VEQSFKQLILEVRKRYRENDFSMCQTDEPLFLPTDLSLMLQYLNKRHRMLQLKAGIISDGSLSLENMTVADISNMVREQMERFIKLFSFSEDKFMEG
jgi:nitrate reductase assembly molybdenum cofactor insertion protein NarJ